MTRKYRRLTDAEVLLLFTSGRYKLEGDTVVGPSGNVLSTHTDGKGYRFVRFYEAGARRAMAFSVVVWMVHTGQFLPENFVVHHRDRDPCNNEWDNLYALHKEDHYKLHNSDLIVPPTEEEIPF